MINAVGIPSLLPSHQFAIGAAMLAGLIAFVSLAFAIILKRRERTSAAYAAALERLNEIALGVAGAPGEIAPLLDHLALAARDLLDMPISRIALLTDERDSMLAAHRFGDVQGAESHELAIFNSHDAVLKCLKLGRAIFVSDTKQTRAIEAEDRLGLLNIPMLQKQQIESVIVLPLISLSQPVGLMVLAQAPTELRARVRRPRAFTQVERRLAQLLAAHAAATISNARLYQRMDEAIRSHRKVQAQRDTVYTVNTSMQRARSMKEALLRVAELAPTALDVDACAVCLVDDEQSPQPASPLTFFGDSMLVAAVTPLPYPFPLRAGTVEHSPIFERVIRTSRAIVIEDTRETKMLRGEGSINPSPIGSVLCMPLLFKNDAPVGALMFTRREKGNFSEDTVKLAEMFSSRAAIAIENARLQEQARRDTDTKATLLAELNHRVKNNLAGLIGLLSMGTPPLSHEAQRWLDRVIERIGALARAHDLFSGGGEVRLGRIIATTLDSIAAIKPDGVRVSVELGGNDIVLSAGQAIPAALVTYELAYNAIIHGAGETGGLDVRVRRPATDTIAIDLIDHDDPRAPHSTGNDHNLPAKPFTYQRSRGVGLELVRELVSRELRGTFDIHANSRGGTTATVSFPIDPQTLTLTDPAQPTRQAS